VTEIAAVGAAAIFVPFPAAVDDHQTTNAQFLVAQGGGWLLPQAPLTPQSLAELLSGLTREALLKKATQAKTLEKLGATEAVVMACEELTR
jgi:UDP-N-acetylglucosamine--N-acetylmuramyl-(pentapeptide) pyrophosphoryl-undecaprenol N-acetylglucosamine transferase